jgi:P27 family predicted phage terminase small subunit
MTAPEGLSAPGRAAWRSAVATLERIGEDPALSRGALTLYARAVDTAHVVRRSWLALGRPTLSEGSSGQPVEHPLLPAMRDQERHVERLAEPLGLTLPARNKARRLPGRPPGSASAADRRPVPALRRVD